MHCASCGGRCHIYVEKVSFYSCDFGGLVYLTICILVTGAMLYSALQHLVMWMTAILMQYLESTICPATVTENKSNKFIF